MDVDEFRTKVRTWLADHAEKYRDDAASGESRAFRSALWDEGLLGLNLDPAYGGQGLGPEYQDAFDQEAAGFTLPPLGEAVTTGICAPTLLDFGTEEQKKRYLPAHDPR